MRMTKEKKQKPVPVLEFGTIVAFGIRKVKLFTIQTSTLSQHKVRYNSKQTQDIYGRDVVVTPVFISYC